MRFLGQVAAAWLALTVFTPGSAPAQDKAGVFDYYALVLNWSPSYCATRSGGGRRDEPQCSGDRPYAFILHGLWPQYERGWPGNCRTAERPWVPNELIQEMLDIMPSKRLVIHEYRKHGTCSGLSPQDYFRISRQLYEQIEIPARFQNPEGYLTVSPGEVEAEFLKANPDLKPEMISIACKGRHLGDLRICFTRDLKLRACGVNERQEKLCSSEKVVMPPVRAGAFSASQPNGRQGRRDRDDRQDGDSESGSQGEDYESDDRY